MSVAGVPAEERPNRPLLEPALLRRLERLSVVNRRRLASTGKGERRSLRRGTSLEFVDYRQYTPGDDLRQIDWNVYGRLDSLVLKLFEDEEILSIHVLLDASRSMDWGSPNKLTYACQVAAALGYVGLLGYDTVEVAVLGQGARGHFGPARGHAGMAGLLRFLGSVQGSGPTDLDGAVRQFVARPRPPGLVLFFSDLFDNQAIPQALGRLGQQRHEVLIFHMLSPEELRPSLAGDLRLLDRETGEAVEVTLDRRAIDDYGARLREWMADIGSFCRKRQMGYYLLDTSRPISQLLFHDLRERGVLA